MSASPATRVLVRLPEPTADESFRALGSEVRLIVTGHGARAAVECAARLLIDGRRAHHLIDPRSGEPAWTGLLAATALAPTTLHAETLAKVALMSGAVGASEVLERHGGLIVHKDGSVEAIGPLAEIAP